MRIEAQVNAQQYAGLSMRRTNFQTIFEIFRVMILLTECKQVLSMRCSQEIDPRLVRHDFAKCPVTCEQNMKIIDDPVDVGPNHVGVQLPGQAVILGVGQTDERQQSLNSGLVEPEAMTQALTHF